MSTTLPGRWAVTGATGLLGNNLVRMLVGRGVEVSVLARGGSRPELAGLKLDVHAGDLGDEAALRRCFDGADVVVHAAASVHIGMSGREEAERVNVGGTEAVCRALPPGARILHVSTVDALGLGTRARPANEDSAPRPEEGGVPYLDTKRAADRVVRAAGVDHVIVHPTLMLGAWDWRVNVGKMLLAVQRGEAVAAPPGGNNFVHVRDVCEAMLRAATGPAGRAWILGNENLDYREAWTRIAAVVGGRPPRFTLPRWVGPAATWLTGLPLALGAEEGEVNAATTRFGFVDHYFDPSRARVELGMAATPFEEGVADAWAWLVAHGHAPAGRSPGGVGHHAADERA